MLISLGFCLVLAATYSLCHFSDALAPETVRFPSKYQYENTDSVNNIRNKRSVFGIGKGVWAGYKAAKELLKDAWPIASNFANRKAYVKPGNYEKAVSDFRSVNPTNVHPFELPGGIKGEKGRVGDRVLWVQNKANSDEATLKIIKGYATKKERTKEITYTKNPLKLPKYRDKYFARDKIET